MKKRILLMCIMLMMMTTYAFAAPDPNWIIKKGYQPDNVGYMQAIDSSGNLGSVAQQMTVLLGAAGIGIGACVGIIYAIMWVTATPSKKADLKERAYPLVIGIILLFGGPGLAASFISGLSKILQ